MINSGHIIGEIGELISGSIEGRATADEITLFKGLGLAIEDLAAANFIYNEAVRLQKGIEIAF
ncbi:ornithine cyclodeaminase [compost metagenome]